MGEMDFKNRGELVYKTLKQGIPDLRPKPGQMISKNDIYERFGASRTPVHNALRLLQEQGFTEATLYRGAYVTLLNLDNIKQMIYIHATMETMVLRGFLEVQTPMVIENIRHSIAQQRAVIRESGFGSEQSYRMDVQMHSTWFAAVRRQKLWEMLQAQQLHYTRSRMLGFIMETGFTHIIGEHEDLFRLIVDRSEKRLEEALRGHFCHSMKRMCRSIEVDYKGYFEEESEEGRFVIW